MGRASPALLSLLLLASFARADGGLLCLRQRAGGYDVAVFTAPTPLRVGPVDISVLVQDAATSAVVPMAEVRLRLTARASSQTLNLAATRAAATNKLLHAAVFDLPEPGIWDVLLTIAGPSGDVSVRCEILADDALPHRVALWPWYVAPAILVALFAVHQALARRPSRRKPRGQ